MDTAGPDDTEELLAVREKLLGMCEDLLAVLEKLLACEEVAPGWIDASPQLGPVERQVWASLFREAIATAKGEVTR